MIFKTANLQNVKLVMFERTMMPESTMKEVDGKKSFVKTGNEVEMTTYTFRDGMGDKFVTMSKDNSYRSLEGEMVDISVELKHNSFTNKTQTSLASVAKAQPQL